MVTVVLDPAGRAAAAARRTVHGMDPGLRSDDLPLDAGQELLALGQAQTQGAQIGKSVGLGNPHDIGAVFFALSSDADQPHDPGHVASTSAGIQAENTSSGLAPPISRQSPHLAEFGIVAAQGRRKVKDLITGLDNTEIPELARIALWQIADQIDECDKRIDALERRILAWHKSDEASCNLATIPGIGPITASAIAATVPDPSAFRNGRQLAAWLGLVPRQHSSGGKDRLSGITKAGNTYIRRLLVIGATSVIRYARSKAPGTAEWLKKLLDRKSARLASVALANKMARIAWSVLTRGEVYRNTYPVPKPT